MDLFSLYVLFSHLRARDVTPGNSFFQCRLMHVHMYAQLMKKQKENSLRNITWSEMGKQNVQEEVHWLQTGNQKAILNLYPLGQQCVLSSQQTACGNGQQPYSVSDVGQHVS